MRKTSMRISVKLALQSFTEQVYETVEAKLAYTEAMEVRNQLIREARSNGVPSRTLERITGLSRDRIARIVTSPPGFSRGSDS